MKATMASHKNNMKAIRNIETRVGKVAKQLAERKSSQFSVNNQTNPKEHCNNAVTEKEEKNENEGNREKRKELRRKK